MGKITIEKMIELMGKVRKGDKFAEKLLDDMFKEIGQHSIKTPKLIDDEKYQQFKELYNAVKDFVANYNLGQIDQDDYISIGDWHGMATTEVYLSVGVGGFECPSNLAEKFKKMIDLSDSFGVYLGSEPKTSSISFSVHGVFK